MIISIKKYINESCRIAGKCGNLKVNVITIVPLLPLMEPVHFLSFRDYFLHVTPVALIVSLSQLDVSYYMNS